MIILYAVLPEQLTDAKITHFFIIDGMPKLWIPLIAVDEECSVCDQIPDNGTFQPWNQEGGPGPACRRCLAILGHDVQEWDGKSAMITNYTEADVSVKCEICRESMDIVTKINHEDQPCTHAKCSRCSENEVCVKAPVMRRT